MNRNLKNCSLEMAAKRTYLKNLQRLMTEIFKSVNHLNPQLAWEFRGKKHGEYNLRIQNLCKLPSIKTTNFGLESLSLGGSLLWNTLDDSMKRKPTLACFEAKNQKLKTNTRVFQKICIRR